MKTTKNKLLVVLGLTALCLGASIALGSDPCGYGGQGTYDYSVHDTVSSCAERWVDTHPPAQLICSLVSPNWGKNQTCDFWCCYDANGHFMDRKVGDCGSCDWNQNCCNMIKGCNESAQGHLGGISCKMDQ